MGSAEERVGLLTPLTSTRLRFVEAVVVRFVEAVVGIDLAFNS
jgi:hypothetical protein